MKNAFNRDRETQKVYRVYHPMKTEFVSAHEKNRQPRETQICLYELAAYFSAYHVLEGMIDELEALLVRGFANDLLNARMETFEHTKRKKRV